MPPETWKEYCWLKRRAEYLEHRYSYAYKYRKQEIDTAYQDVVDRLPAGCKNHELSGQEVGVTKPSRSSEIRRHRNQRLMKRHGTASSRY